MDEKNTGLPAIDTLIRSRDLQILKAMVPYLQESQQRTISFLIRLIELQKTMQLFDTGAELKAAGFSDRDHDTPPERMKGMLQAMKEFCTPQEQEQIESVIGFFEMYESYAAITGEGPLL